MTTQNLNNKNQNPKKRTNWFSKIIAGDILLENVIQKNVLVFLVAVLLIIAYINNRYLYQRDLIEKNKLELVLKDIKYRALTRSAVLMDKSRQSKIEEHISQKGIDLKIPSNPPFIIK